MDFKEYAAKEAAELVDKLARAASSGAQAAVQRVSDEAKARLEALESDLEARIHDLEAAVVAEGREREALQAEHAALTSDHVSLKSEHTVLASECAALETSKAALASEHEALKSQHAALASEHESLRRKSAAAEAASEKLRHDAQTAQVSLERFRQETLAAQEKLRADAHAAQERLRQELQGKIDAAVAAHGRAAEQAKTAEAQLRAARAQAEASRAEVEAVRAEADAIRAEMAAPDSLLERLLVSFESLAAAPGINDLLVALAESLAAEFSRVALFRVKGNKLQGEYQTGFEFATDVAKVVIPLSMDSLLARAVASGCIETMEADTGETVHSPFGGSPTCAFALPVAAGGETLGILYADDGPAGVPETPAARAVKGRYAEVLLRHAVALVLRLTAELRTIAELRGHAARLLDHAEDMYAADVDAGVQGADLQARLLENLECARRLYAQRVAVEGPAAAGLLEDQLVLLLEQRAGTPFGRDLATVSSAAAERAEAS